MIGRRRIWKKEFAGHEFTSPTYGGYTEECGEANANLAEKTKELSKQIELMMSLGELREKSNAWEGDKSPKANEEAGRREEVERILPTIIEEVGAGSVTDNSLHGGFASQEESAISENSGIRGGPE